MTGSTTNLHPTLFTLLTQLESKVGFTLHVTSGYRDPTHNKDVGGVEHSEHTYDPAQAADIACPDGSSRWKLITQAIQLGCVRLGIGKDFIHIGIAVDKPQHVIWGYYEKS